MADETNRTPDETLRAAWRLRQVDGTATPWTATWQEDDWWSITGGPYAGMARPETASTIDRNNARRIATDWDLLHAVEKVAIAISGTTRVAHSTHTEALDVARAVLGEA